MRDNIEISVLIPAYNSEKYIAGALNSVWQQTVLPLEIIIVDDGSKDNTISVINQFIRDNDIQNNFIKIISQDNAGAGEARNTGIKNVNGNWIAFLDSDDLWESEKIEKVVMAIKENPSCSIIAHDEKNHYVNSDKADDISGLYSKYNSEEDLFVQLYRGNFISTSSVVIEKELFNRAGFFDTTLQPAEDYGMWMKLAKNGKLYYMPDILTSYIVRNDSISSNIERRYEAEIRICKDNYNELIKRTNKVVARKIARKRIFRIHLCEGHCAFKSQNIKLLLKIGGKMLPSIISIK